MADPILVRPSSCESISWWLSEEVVSENRA